MAARRSLVAFLCVTLLLASVLPSTVSAEAYTDAWGYTDDDGDGLILVTVPWETCTAYMLIVLDPTRVVLGCRPDRLYSRGYTVAEYAEQFGAVAGVNGGGFVDEGGTGNGSVPEHAIVSNGEVYCGWSGVGEGFAGIDAEGVLHLGFQHVEELTAKNIKEGAGYGPVLIQDGQRVDPSTSVFSYWIDTLNPRTAIGQRSDGAILLLVFDGRQPNSLGASFEDETEIMLQFGAVNAANLDGGNSSMLWLNGRYLNNPAGTFDIRPIPTSFLVLPQNSDSKTSVSEIFARKYIENYVNFSADAGGMSTVHYYSLRDLVVPDGDLLHRLHGAFGSFGYASVKSVRVLSVEEDFCTENEDGTYSTGYVYRTESIGRRTAVEEKKIQLTVVRLNGKLVADSMRFY